MSPDMTGIRYPTETDLDQLLAREPQVASTACGPMEYADTGAGPVLLSLHPASGGWDAGLGMAAPFWANGMRVIAPSRPGYLGTPPGTGSTPTAQADALAALMDTLGIDSCDVVGHCAGGVIGYLFAARHPDRVRRLVAISTPTDPDIGVSPAIFKVIKLAMTHPLVDLVLLRDRMLLGGSAEGAARQVIGGDSTLDRDAVAALAHRVMADPARAFFITRVWATRTRRGLKRIAGTRLDMLQVDTVLTDPPLTDIACPTLVVHGGAELLDLRHAERAVAEIPHAELRVITDGCHHGFWINDDAVEQQAAVLTWLHPHTSRPATPSSDTAEDG